MIEAVEVVKVVADVVLRGGAGHALPSPSSNEPTIGHRPGQANQR